VPQLASRRMPETGALSIPPREMAALALRHRHNTIRGKTVNQRLFSMEWIDQFYWLVDERTLIAHQLPIAVVCMRPTRVLTEMRTFWDYGILSEACPGVNPCVLADSDDFLMIELRRADTARDQISLGWPTPREIAEKLEKFITRDPISLARHTLVLHSGDLPADLDRAKAELDAYVEAVLRVLPAELSDHVNHPIWAYHYPRFQKARRDYLIRRGSLEGSSPVSEPEPVDPAVAVAAPVAEASLAAPSPQRSLSGSLAFTLYRRVFGLAPDLRPWHPRWGDVQPVLRAVAAAGPGARVLVVSSECLPERLFRNLAAEHACLRDIVGVLPSRGAGDGRQDERSIGTPPPRAPRADNDTPRLFSIKIEQEMPVMIATSADAAPQAARLQSLQMVWCEAGLAAENAAAPQAESDAAGALCEGPAPAGRSFTGTQIGQPDSAVAAVGPDAPPVTEEFDLCVCEVNSDDLMEMRPLIRNLAPRVRRGGSILVFHLGHPMAAPGSVQALIPDGVLALDLPCRFHFTGSALAAQALLGFTAAVNNLRSRRPAAMARGAIKLGSSLLRAWWTSRITPSTAGRPPDCMTSFVIEISVIRHPGTPVCAAVTEEMLQPAQ